MLGNALALYKKVETKKSYLPVAAIPIGFTVKFINAMRFAIVETSDRSPFCPSRRIHRMETWANRQIFPLPNPGYDNRSIKIYTNQLFLSGLYLRDEFRLYLKYISDNSRII